MSSAQILPDLDDERQREAYQDLLEAGGSPEDLLYLWAALRNPEAMLAEIEASSFGAEDAVEPLEVPK
jgi:hypothetical protein